MNSEQARYRRWKRRAIVALGVALLAGVAWRSLVVADETQYVLVTGFGRPAALYGDEAGEAGPHPKWPWQSTYAIDRRLQFFDPPPREVITGDKKNLEVAGLVAWRVADPVAFLRSAGTNEAAEARLEERVASALSDAIGRRELASLATTDPEVWALDELTAEVRDAVADAAREELGVEVVEVRLRRFNHPIEVRPAVFDLIRSERRQVAAQLRAEGEAEYRTITSRADRDREAILAEADAEAERIRADGQAEATRLLNEAQAIDPRFAAFLRTLEAYRSILDARATVVLSSDSPLLKLLSEGPDADLIDPPPASTSPIADRPTDASSGGEE